MEFFAGRIANARTRATYGRAVGQFLGWCEARGLRLGGRLAPTVKQHLAAIRMLGDWLVVSQVVPLNPAAAVRGPKHVVTKGATPVLSTAEARKLLESTKRSPVRGRGAPALDVLPHVPGDGDHDASVERGHPRARAADRGARVAEDDEALRTGTADTVTVDEIGGIVI